MTDAGASATPPAAAFRERASRAMALLSLQSAFARIVLFVSNWVLGGLLSQQDFGVSGMVSIVVAAAFTLVGFGMDDVILQRGARMHVWETTTTRLSMIIALVATAGLAASAPVMAWIYREPAVIGPILVVCASLPIAALSVVPQARLHSRMDFVFITQWGVADLFIVQGLTILFAILGFGAYSFVLPLPISYAARAIAYNLRAPTPPKPARRRAIPRAPLLRRGGMVTGSKLVNNLIAQGDYFILGAFASTLAVGYYFFAFRLAAAPVRTIAQSLTTVLFPTMTAMQADPRRLAAAAVKAATLLSWIITPFCFFQMALAEPVLRMLFGEKWGPSIPIIQLLCIGMSMEAIMAAARAYLSAAGKFDLQLRYSLINGAGFFIACAIGVWLGGAVGLALAISVYYLATQPVVFLWLADLSGQRIRNFFTVFVLPLAASAIAFGLGWGATRLDVAPSGWLAQIAVITVVGWTAMFVLFALLAPGPLGELVDLAKRIANRRKTT